MNLIPNANEIQLIRMYDAPLKTVWDAWTDPGKAAQWWGPRGFTITNHSKDLRVGGHWKYTMHGPDGVDYPNHTKYFEVVPLKRLVYDHGGNENQPPMFRVTVQFSDAPFSDGPFSDDPIGDNKDTKTQGRTLMEMTMAFPSAAAASEAKVFIKKAGGNATWDRLAEYLAKETGGKEPFVINRSFEAPIEPMYEMWTDPKLFSKWLAPTGSTMEFIRTDIVPGGESFYSMTAANNVKMYGRICYRELQKPGRIVYTQQFTDKSGKISRHPLAPTWPETMHTTVTFAKEGQENTRVTIVWEAHGEVTAEELQTFVHARAGMTGGWTGSFDKLEEYLAARAKF